MIMMLIFNIKRKQQILYGLKLNKKCNLPAAVQLPKFLVVRG